MVASVRVAGSCGVRPNSWLWTSFVRASEAGTPAATPIATRMKHFAHDHPDDATLGGTEGHTNADFAGALRDGVGHDAIETDDGQKGGKKTEDGGEAGDHALGGERVVDLNFSGAHGSRWG